ncbi:hypothetical protein SNEBB_003757 [Seison nebaliae]|nr:hypothetical protein SNEBB_003757 [Seison nebaliae]
MTPVVVCDGRLFVFNCDSLNPYKIFESSLNPNDEWNEFVVDLLLDDDDDYFRFCEEHLDSDDVKSIYVWRKGKLKFSIYRIDVESKEMHHVNDWNYPVNVKRIIKLKWISTNRFLLFLVSESEEFLVYSFQSTIEKRLSSSTLHSFNQYNLSLNEFDVNNFHRENYRGERFYKKYNPNNVILTQYSTNRKMYSIEKKNKINENNLTLLSYKSSLKNGTFKLLRNIQQKINWMNCRFIYEEKKQFFFIERRREKQSRIIRMVWEEETNDYQLSLKHFHFEDSLSYFINPFSPTLSMMKGMELFIYRFSTNIDFDRIDWKDDELKRSSFLINIPWSMNQPILLMYEKEMRLTILRFDKISTRFLFDDFSLATQLSIPSIRIESLEFFSFQLKLSCDRETEEIEIEIRKNVKVKGVLAQSVYIPIMSCLQDCYKKLSKDDESLDLDGNEENTILSPNKIMNKSTDSQLMRLLTKPSNGEMKNIHFEELRHLHDNLSQLNMWNDSDDDEDNWNDINNFLNDVDDDHLTNDLFDSMDLRHPDRWTKLSLDNKINMIRSTRLMSLTKNVIIDLLEATYFQTGSRLNRLKKKNRKRRAYSRPSKRNMKNARLDRLPSTTTITTLKNGKMEKNTTTITMKEEKKRRTSKSKTKMEKKTKNEGKKVEKKSKKKLLSTDPKRVRRKYRKKEKMINENEGKMKRKETDSISSLFQLNHPERNHPMDMDDNHFSELNVNCGVNSYFIDNNISPIGMMDEIYSNQIKEEKLLSPLNYRSTSPPPPLPVPPLQLLHSQQSNNLFPNTNHFPPQMSNEENNGLKMNWRNVRTNCLSETIRYDNSMTLPHHHQHHHHHPIDYHNSNVKNNLDFDDMTNFNKLNIPTNHSISQSSMNNGMNGTIHRMMDEETLNKTNSFIGSNNSNEIFGSPITNRTTNRMFQENFVTSSHLTTTDFKSPPRSTLRPHFLHNPSITSIDDANQLDNFKQIDDIIESNVEMIRNEENLIKTAVLNHDLTFSPENRNIFNGKLQQFPPTDNIEDVFYYDSFQPIDDSRQILQFDNNTNRWDGTDKRNFSDISKNETPMERKNESNHIVQEQKFNLNTNLLTREFLPYNNQLENRKISQMDGLSHPDNISISELRQFMARNVEEKRRRLSFDAIRFIDDEFVKKHYYRTGTDVMDEVINCNWKSKGKKKKEELVKKENKCEKYDFKLQSIIDDIVIDRKELILNNYELREEEHKESEVGEIWNNMTLSTTPDQIERSIIHERKMSFHSPDSHFHKDTKSSTYETMNENSMLYNYTTSLWRRLDVISLTDHEKSIGRCGIICDKYPSLVASLYKNLQIYQGDNSSLEQMRIGLSNEMSEELIPSGSYSLRCRARNRRNSFSEWSNPLTITIPTVDQLMPPTHPNVLLKKKVADGIFVRWNFPKINRSLVSHFLVELLVRYTKTSCARKSNRRLAVYVGSNNYCFIPFDRYRRAFPLTKATIGKLRTRNEKKVEHHLRFFITSISLNKRVFSKPLIFDHTQLLPIEIHRRFIKARNKRKATIASNKKKNISKLSEIGTTTLNVNSSKAPKNKGGKKRKTAKNKPTKKVKKELVSKRKNSTTHVKRLKEPSEIKKEMNDGCTISSNVQTDGNPSENIKNIYEIESSSEMISSSKIRLNCDRTLRNEHGENAIS